MTDSDTGTIKQREIFFADLHPDPDQAASAAEVLAEIPGIIDTRCDSSLQLSVQYNLMQITLQQIEEGLAESGFHLSGKIIHKIRRALFYYTEETQLANIYPNGDMANQTTRVFVKQYDSRSRGKKDQRPEHWRSYL